MTEFILSFTHKGTADLSPEERYLRAHNELRNNGCHSPTRISTIKVFKAVKKLVLLEKLKKTNVNDKVRSISMTDLVKMLNGPGAELNFTGNGIEFTGWYTEVYLLKLYGMIRISRGTIEITEWFHQIATDPSQTDDELCDELLDKLEQYHLRLREEITSRCNRFGISHLLLELAYANCTPKESWLKSDQALPGHWRD